MTRARSLRELLAAEDILVAPGAYDAWSARLVDLAGFQAAYMTGYGAAASVLAMPDLGIMTGTEMVSQATRMADAITIPLIADADNGFGEVLNVQRAVREYERGGVAAIQLEDQVSPKRCGHMESKRVLPREQMVRHVKAAVAARRDPDMVIIARTDARTVVDFDEALRRGELYAEAGADVLFIESPLDDGELVKVCETFKGIPLIANMAPGCKTPYHAFQDLQAMGFAMVIYPIDTLLAATSAVMEALASIRENGRLKPEQVKVDWNDFNRIMNLEAYVATENALR